MKFALNMIAVAFLGAAIIGCSSSGSDMTKEDADKVKNPGKSGPPPQAAGMNTADMMEKQRKDNATKGVDDHGVPLKNSSAGSEKGPDMSGAKKDPNAK